MACNFDLRSPWNLDSRVKAKLRGTFFDSISEQFLKGYRQCHIFQSFIKDCYDKKKKKFTFGLNDDVGLYFGLQDVFALSGIPVDGKPLICEDQDTELLCRKYLGIPYKDEKKAMRVPKKWLRSSFEEVPEDATEEMVGYHVRAYLLYLIGSTILPHSENKLDYPAYWLQFLDDLNPCNLNGVAWGAAVHCRLITGLERKSYSYRPYWLFEVFYTF